MNVKQLSTTNDYQQVRKLIQKADYTDLYLCQHKIVSLVRPVLKRIIHRHEQFHVDMIINLMSELKSKLSRFQVSSHKCSYLLHLLALVQKHFTIPYALPNHLECAEESAFSGSHQSIKNVLYKNQERSYEYKQLKPEEMKQVNNEVEAITKGTIKLMNPECVGCSQRFYKDWRITHSNLFIRPTLSIPELSQQQLSKAFCAAMNSVTGAIILVGCKIENSCIVSSVPHLSLRQAHEKMKNITSMITPEIEKDCYEIQQVPIYPNIFQTQISPDPEYLLRVRVSPGKISHLSNIKVTLQGERVIYQAYICKQSEKDVNFCEYHFLQKQENYHLIVKKHQQKGKLFYAHQCLEPEPTKYEQRDQEEEDEDSQVYLLKNCGNNEQFDSGIENIFYDYSNFTILLFKKENEKALRDILKQFNKKGKKRIIEIKYRNKESDLIVAYIMGHEYDHEVVKKVWQQIQEKQNVDCHMVTKNIFIQNPTGSEDDSFGSWKYFNKQYEKLFNISTITKKYQEIKEQQSETRFYMVCEHLKHAFMAFLLMEMLNFQPSFQAEETVSNLIDLDQLYK